ncbi:MAG: DUF4239 domain-containing protein [Planctomycetota bacterium]|nr:MAG: DUF4239 domain-containing protein [Planctomycetota bacterium]
MSWLYSNLALAAALLVAALFAGMLALLELGRRLGKRRLAQDPEGARAGLGGVEGAVFGLLALLIAFTFSGAAGRFDTRRRLIAEEANAIGTAWLRLDLLPEGRQPAMRELFRRFLDARLEIYRALPDVRAAEEALARATALQGEIWDSAVAAGNEAPPQVTLLLLPALNAMFDVATSRLAAVRSHQPVVIFALLFGLAFGCSLLAGFGMAPGAERSWLHMLGFAAILVVSIYAILDLEFPRMGLIHVDAADQLLLELRRGMEASSEPAR